MNLYKFQYEDSRGERSNVLPELNRSALAAEMGVSRSQLSRILNGKVEPPLKTMRKLAEALECGLEEVDEWLQELRENRNGRRRR